MFEANDDDLRSTLDGNHDELCLLRSTIGIQRVAVCPSAYPIYAHVHLRACFVVDFCLVLYNIQSSNIGLRNDTLTYYISSQLQQKLHY